MLDLTSIWKTLLKKKRSKINIPFKYPWIIYKTDAILDQKNYFRRFLIVKIMEAILFNNNKIKLNISNRKWST
jgi:hypothetical protein